MNTSLDTMLEDKPKTETIKLLVFDLDHTVWDGTLLEDEVVTLRPEIRKVLETLDSRGILMSIASRNEPNVAMAKLKEFGLDHYFLHPEINWGAKSESLRTIVENLNIGMNTVAFIDDQHFERDEVSHVLPEVRTIDALDLDKILDRDAFKPAIITSESRLRRQMYLADIERGKGEVKSTAPSDEFLATLNMRFKISEAMDDDLLRAEELTRRTSQLNTTGRTFSYQELDDMCCSPEHLVLVAKLVDRYGPYGTIGLAVVEISGPTWKIELLLMSCRVMSRGVGSIMMNYIRNRAREAGVSLEADFVTNDRNRMMYATYKFSGFKEIEKDGYNIRLSCDLTLPAAYPDHVDLHLPELAEC